MFCQWLENYLGTGLSRKLLPTCCLMIRGCLGPWLAKAGQLLNWIYFSKTYTSEFILPKLHISLCFMVMIIVHDMLMKLYCISAYDMPGVCVCVAIKWHMLFNQIEGSIWGNFTAPWTPGYLSRAHQRYKKWHIQKGLNPWNTRQIFLKCVMLIT